jgi:arylsulfatase A-like enzyme
MQMRVGASWPSLAITIGASMQPSLFLLDRKMNRILAVTALLSWLSLAAIAERPNVLVVMVDDLGFSDIGCYGGEIETPNLDALASGGLRFTQFYNTAKCHSSRISLLTGCYALQAGNTQMSRAVTSAEVLSGAGYFTAMTGKWHLDREPTDFGFDRYFGHLSGACNYFSGDKTFRLNGKPWQVPDDGFYTTVADVDFAIDFLSEARQTSKPWYLYVAFNAPHAPLQALEQDYRKYVGRYDDGWDAIRDARIAKQKQIGLFDQDLEPSPRPDHIPAWNTLSPQRRAWENRRMTALAAMIDRVDQEMGRLLDDLKQAGEMDNTLILFVSDNGACPYDRNSNQIDAEPTNESIRWSDSTGWAWARNGPFRYYKQNQYEGGISSPGIVHWPAGLMTEPGSFTHQSAHLIDVLPTLAEICSAPIPTKWPERQLDKVSGVSLAPVFAGRTLDERPPIHLLFGSDRGFRQGDWKLVSFRSQPWELYNLASDRTELINVADQHPERVAQMVQQWHEMATNVLRAPQRHTAAVQTASPPHQHPEWTDFSKQPKDGPGKRTNSNAGPSRGNNKPIRARKETTMKIVGSELQLVSSGTDSGIAIDRVSRELPPGPYVLSFRLRSGAGGSGEVFFTVDAKTTLPRGEHVKFDVTHDGKWHDVTLDLDTTKSIKALRLDVCSQPGGATIADLSLRDEGGTVLIRWPE